MLHCAPPPLDRVLQCAVCVALSHCRDQGSRLADGKPICLNEVLSPLTPFVPTFSYTLQVSPDHQGQMIKPDDKKLCLNPIVLVLSSWDWMASRRTLSAFLGVDS